MTTTYHVVLQGATFFRARTERERESCFLSTCVATVAISPLREQLISSLMGGVSLWREVAVTSLHLSLLLTATGGLGSVNE